MPNRRQIELCFAVDDCVLSTSLFYGIGHSMSGNELL